MKRIFNTTENDIPSLSIILIVPDVNIPTPRTIYASDTLNHSSWSDDDIIEMLENGEVGRLRKVTDFNTLVRIMDILEENPDLEYKFTVIQQDKLTDGFETYHCDIFDDNAQELLDYIQVCDDCTIPHPRKESEDYKNFAKHNKLRLAPEDYLEIVRKFEAKDYQGYVRSKYPDYWGNKIYQFNRTDEFYNSVGESIGVHNLWMEVNFRETVDNEMIALVSLHDAENKAHL